MYGNIFKRDLRLAQMSAGMEPTGYKGDIDEKVLSNVLMFRWQDSIGMPIVQFLDGVLQVIGKKQMAFWKEEIDSFVNKRRGEGKITMHHGNMYVGAAM